MLKSLVFRRSLTYIPRVVHKNQNKIVSTESRFATLEHKDSPLYDLEGVFAINKPPGPSSNKIVEKLKGAINKSFLVKNSNANFTILSDHEKRHSKISPRKMLKVGHGGTLDPLAEGILVIGVGHGTKMLGKYTNSCSKSYEVKVLFGLSTTSFDSTGEIMEVGDNSNITEEKIRSVLQEKFCGELMQIPPIYSAIKMNGKPLYEYVRKNLPLPRAIKPRNIKIDAYEVTSPLVINDPEDISLAKSMQFASDEERALLAECNEKIMEYISESPDLDTSKLTSLLTSIDFEKKTIDNVASIKIRFDVSSGTYIRSIVHDLGKALGTAATMTMLKRTKQDTFELGKNVLSCSEIFSDSDINWAPKVSAILVKS